MRYLPKKCITIFLLLVYMIYISEILERRKHLRILGGLVLLGQLNSFLKVGVVRVLGNAFEPIWLEGYLGHLRYATTNDCNILGINGIAARSAGGDITSE